MHEYLYLKREAGDDDEGACDNKDALEPVQNDGKPDAANAA